MLTLRRLILLYLVLLLFEGALRKWFLPGYSSYLLIIRDPLALLIYAQALRARLLPLNGIILATLALALLSALLGLFATDNSSLIVTLYGLRSNFLHLPLIFVIGRALDLPTIIRWSRPLILLAIPMALLTIAQFRAAPEHWLNCGAGGVVNGQITAALGKIRPAGTFSYYTGVGFYFTLVAALGLLHLNSVAPRSRLFASVALLTVAFATPFAASRALVLALLVLLAFYLALGLLNPRLIPRAFGVLVFAALALGAVMSFDFFKEGRDVYRERFEAGQDVQTGGMASIQRIIKDYNVLDSLATADLVGAGIGAGTNAASVLSTGQRSILLSENEFNRVILEMGVILGSAYLLLRVTLALTILAQTIRAARRDSNPAPFILLGAGFLLLLNAVWAQPTTQGFATFIAGLVLASLSRPDDHPAQSRPTPHRDHTHRPRTLHSRGPLSVRPLAPPSIPPQNLPLPPDATRPAQA